jgi:hypothetical protein
MKEDAPSNLNWGSVVLPGLMKNGFALVPDGSKGGEMALSIGAKLLELEHQCSKPEKKVALLFMMLVRLQSNRVGVLVAPTDGLTEIFPFGDNLGLTIGNVLHPSQQGPNFLLARSCCLRRLEMNLFLWCLGTKFLFTALLGARCFTGVEQVD